MRDETAKDNRQTAAISHDLTRNNELAFSSTRNLQFCRCQIVKFFFLDFGFGRIGMNDRIRRTDTALKLRPNDSNISTQHIPTLLAQHLQCRPNDRNIWTQQIATFIVGRNMLHAFGHPVATCCELKIELVRMPRRNTVARTWPNDYNIMQHPQILHEKLDHFQIWANNTQHVATRRD